MFDIFLVAITLTQSPYCAGFEKGYVAGWCSKNTSICPKPVVPACPVPQAGRSKEEHGVVDGISAGRQALEQWESKSKGRWGW